MVIILAKRRIISVRKWPCNMVSISVANEPGASHAADFQQYDMIYALAGDVLQEIRRIAGKHFDASKVQLLMDALHPGNI